MSETYTPVAGPGGIDFLVPRLIDELHLTVSPVALTAGLPLFLHPAALTLVDSRPFPGSGNLLLRYRPAK